MEEIKYSKTMQKHLIKMQVQYLATLLISSSLLFLFLCQVRTITRSCLTTSVTQGLQTAPSDLWRCQLTLDYDWPLRLRSELEWRVGFYSDCIEWLIRVKHSLVCKQRLKVTWKCTHIISSKEKYYSNITSK